MIVDLDEVREVINSSAPGDWIREVAGSPPASPVQLYRCPLRYLGGESEVGGDLRITVSPAGRVSRAHEELVQEFATAGGWHFVFWMADIEYRGQVVDRRLMMLIDCPTPVIYAAGEESALGDDPGSPSIPVMDEFHYQLGRLLHGCLLGDRPDVWEVLERFRAILGSRIVITDRDY